jgi:hypothetical protein
MPRQFFHVTAELVVAAIDSVQAYKKATSAQVANFCDISAAQAAEATLLAVDLKLLGTDAAGAFVPSPPLAAFAAAPGDRQRSAMLRIALESYDPFLRFRERLVSTDSVDLAAAQTKQLLDLTSHREEVKDTLLSLGTYTNAFKAKGGGRYAVDDNDLSLDMQALAQACAELAEAEKWIIQQIGNAADSASRNDVILPLARSVLKANAGESRNAIGEAGNAVESFLAELAARMNVNLQGAAGINQKLDKFRSGNHLPKKVVEAAKYLGQVRNAADHGIDVEVNAQWVISQQTAKIYPAVACQFISAAVARERGQAHIL